MPYFSCIHTNINSEGHLRPVSNSTLRKHGFSVAASSISNELATSFLNHLNFYLCSIKISRHIFSELHYHHKSLAVPSCDDNSHTSLFLSWFMIWFGALLSPEYYQGSCYYHCCYGVSLYLTWIAEPWSMFASGAQPVLITKDVTLMPNLHHDIASAHRCLHSSVLGCLSLSV